MCIAAIDKWTYDVARGVRCVLVVTAVAERGLSRMSCRSRVCEGSLNRNIGFSASSAPYGSWQTGNQLQKTNQDTSDSNP